MRPASWYASNVIWHDPCYTIRPAGPEKAQDQNQANKLQKRFISDDAKEYSRNLKGPGYAKKQRSWGDCKFHWILVLTRGRIHVEVLPEEWQPDAIGMASFVALLPGILQKMLPRQRSKPRQIYTDRGAGMYVPKTGQACSAYAEAVRKAKLKLYNGEDASRQPAGLADVLLHETAIANFKYALGLKPVAVEPWKETHALFRARVAKVVQEANRKCRFLDLCREYPVRLQILVNKRGDRLRK